MVDVRLEMAPGLVVEGTPDARGIQYGDTARSLIEVKTYGHARNKYWQSVWTEGMKPAAMMQASAYRLGLLALGEIDTDAPIVFAALDTDTREWDTGDCRRRADA